jgi:uncharacterized protein
MVELSGIEGFDWDDGNDRKNLHRHAVTQAEAEQVFVDPGLLILDDQKHSHDDVRYQAYGRTSAGRLLHLSFTLRKDGVYIRVISARDASRKERARYEEAA